LSDLAFDAVSFIYTDSPSPALHQINLQVQPGEAVLLTGPSGAGKTSLASCANGLIPHFHEGTLSGQVTVRGRDTRRTRIGALAALVGMVFQDPESQLVAPSVVDEVAFGAENLGVPREEINRRVAEALEVCRLGGLEDRPPHSLSGGEQQATAIASIYAMHPEIYVMDEPTSNLDPLGTRQILSLVARVARERGRTLLLAEHKLEEALPLVDRVLVMHRGQIVRQGAPAEVLTGGDIPGVFTRPALVRLAERLGLPGTPLTADEFYALLTTHRQLRPQPNNGSADLTPPDESHAVGPPGEPVIQLEDVEYAYDGAAPALRGVSLTVRRGELVAILGRNGSGKSTLVRHVNGLLRPRRGRVAVLGRDAAGMTTAQLARHVGFCFQNPNHQLLTFRVREELAFGPRSLGLPDDEVEQRSREALEAVGLGEAWDVDVAALGKGQKQRLALASVLTMRPEILIIDEPTTGQDPGMTADIFRILQRLNEAGTTILLITHQFDMAAEFAARAVILRQGRVDYDGPMAALLLQADRLRANSLDQPEVTKLAAKLAPLGVRPDLVTVEAVAESLLARGGGRGD
jgi:energy-coupling factor transport system ATP-binding protein